MSTMSTTFAPVELLFQPAEKKTSAFAIPKAKRSLPREPEVRLWKLSQQVASQEVSVVTMMVLFLFLAIAVAGMGSCFVELSHLLQSDAVGLVAERAITGSF
jgi:hypothetical protein